jgi:cystathionine beta-lyase/cystathionine gamma-synthase
MAAITSALLSLLRRGDHLLAQDVLYGGTRTFLSEDLPQLGVEVEFVAEDDAAAWQRRVRPNTRAVYVESLTNPLLHVTDLLGIARMARAAQLVSIIDNTIPTPLYFRPIEHGFDLVVHSATKFLNGHSDIVAGAVLGRRELVERALHKLNHLGGSLDPHACMLLHRGMRTLKLRLDHQSATALELARRLAQHRGIGAVYHPGLPAHASHGRAAQYFDGYGALLSFRLEKGRDVADKFLRSLRLALFAPSFGGTETLITRPATSSHAGLCEADRARLGLDDGLLRVAVGLEDAVDLCRDFDAALHRVGACECGDASPCTA